MFFSVKQRVRLCSSKRFSFGCTSGEVFNAFIIGCVYSFLSSIFVFHHEKEKKKKKQRQKVSMVHCCLNVHWRCVPSRTIMIIWNSTYWLFRMMSFNKRHFYFIINHFFLCVWNHHVIYVMRMRFIFFSSFEITDSILFASVEII